MPAKYATLSQIREIQPMTGGVIANENESPAVFIRLHPERHLVSRIGWLRAAVLGANDGIVSTSSLILGVAAAGAERDAILIAGAAGLVAGAMSMAAGEYVSVSSQADTEHADVDRERSELATDTAAERKELTQIYVRLGLDREKAESVGIGRAGC